MIFRVFRIVLTFAMIFLLWFAYDQLSLLRRTVLWEFRYLVWITSGFLILSLVEWGLGWLYRKLHSE